MEMDNVLWMLTALAAVVVLLTWMRMKASAARTGHAAIPHWIVTGHTIFGVVAIGVWSYYLSSPSDVVGWAALALWWVEVLLGLLILLRWLPSSHSGTHADGSKDDSWADGPALSMLGHVGMLLGVCFFTFVVLTDRIAG